MTNTPTEAEKELRHRAEDKAFIDEATAAKPFSQEDKESLLYELRVSQIELEMQNEELLRTQGELEELVVAKSAALQQSDDEMNQIAFQLVWAEERKLERIAGELHDQVSQSLLLAKMKLEALTDNILPDSLRKHAEDACSLLTTSISDIKSLTSRMRPTILDTAEIATALEYLCSSIGDDYSIQIDFTDDCQPKPLPAEVRYLLYQAVRELLLHILKHAGVENAQLSLKTDSKSLVVLVTDNGGGINNPETRLKHSNICGYDFYSVKQRMRFMGGSFSVDPDPDKGTLITLTVPLGEEGRNGWQRFIMPALKGDWWGEKFYPL